jgi:hypothetical protein
MLDHAVWRDINNNGVHTEAEAYGQNTRYSVLHPETLVFLDEVCENISQKGDGNVSRQKFMVTKDTRKQVRKSFKDNHFNVLDFTATYGRAVMCVIIITASKLKVTGVLGCNPLSKDTEDSSSDEMEVLEEEIHEMKDEHTNGVDRMFPFRRT